MLPRDQSAMRVAYYTAVRDKLAAQLEARQFQAELDRARTRLGEMIAAEDMHIGRNVAALVERALLAEGGVATRAAKRLGVNTTTLWRWRNGLTRKDLTHYKIPAHYSAAKLNRPKKSHCINGHALTPDNVYASPNAGVSQCRTCRTARDAARRDRTDLVEVVG